MFRTHETKLLDRLLRYLAGRADVRVAGPTDATLRAPTVSIVPLRRPVADVASHWSAAG